MKRTTRRILFYSLALLFAVAGPLAVITSLGYSFRFSTATFESTGGIFIKSDTARTSVFLNGAFVRETGFITGSTLLTDVVPGTHLVRLEKQDYRPWSKTVAVSPAAVTEFRDVFLVPYLPSVATSSAEEVFSLRAERDASNAENAMSFIFSMDKKNRLLITESKKTRAVAENVHSFTPTEQGAFFVGQNGFLASYDILLHEAQTIARPGFFLGREPFRFVRGDHFLAVVDSSGGLFLYDMITTTMRPIASGAKEIFFDSAEEKLLIVKEQAIDILWLTDNPVQPFQKKDTVETVVQTDDLIREGRWYFETDRHVVFRTRHGVFIAETDTRGGANQSQLISVPVDEIITSPLAPSAVFYRDGKALYKIEF